MRLALLLVVRTGTAIVVATAAVQFWNLAVRGETPSLGPSIALPPTPTAVAAIVPRPKGGRGGTDRPREAKPAAAQSGSTQGGSAGATPSGTVPPPSSGHPATKGTQQPVPPVTAHGKGASPPSSPPTDEAPAPTEVPEPPADPQIVPQPPQPPPPPPDDEAEPAHHPPPHDHGGP